MTTAEYLIRSDEDLIKAQNDFSYRLVESRHHRQRLDLTLSVDGADGSRILFEFLTLMKFYGAGHLKEYDCTGQQYALIRKNLIGEELVVERPTLVLGDVEADSTVVVKNRLIIAGALAGTAVLRGKDAHLQARTYAGSRIITPAGTLTDYRAENEVISL